MIREINNTDLRNFTEATSTSVTGTTAQTKMTSILIPGGTFNAGDLIEIEALFTKANTNNVFKMTFEYNTTDSLTGATQLAIYTTASASTIFLTTSRRFLVRNAAGSGTGLDSGTSGLKGNSDFANDYVSETQDDSPINWRNDVYIICSVLLSSSFDTVTQRFLKVYTP